MKTIATIAALALATGIATAQTQRREIRLSDCPQPVQATIQQNSRGGHIDEVDFISIDGKDIYIAEVELPRDRDLKIYVNGGGSLVMTPEAIALRETPAAVRRAVQGLGGTVDDVDKEIAGQVVTYHIEIDRHGARDLDVVVAENGTILSQTEEADDD